MKRRIGYDRIRRLNWYYLNEFGVKTKTSEFTVKASDDILDDINITLDMLTKNGINRQ